MTTHSTPTLPSKVEGRVVNYCINGQTIGKTFIRKLRISPPSLRKITIMFVKIDNNSIIKSDIAIIVKL